MNIASWIRETDELLFAQAFAFAPEVHLCNARLGKVDLSAADAFLLTGGSDIGADHLRQPVPNPSPLRKSDPARDAWEFAAVTSFFPSGRPILAICRGHQILNVSLGGTLILDIPGHNLKEQRDHDVQRLRFADGVPATRRFAQVNSSHHQAVDRVAEGMTVEAWHDSDNIIEQVRHQTHPWCVGVQYHPERGTRYRSLFQDFVATIRGQKESRG